MKKIIGYLILIIINYLVISLIVFTFSYTSLVNNKTYDLLWVKYIQKKLYFSGVRKLWNIDPNCSRYDKDLLYAPLEGKCKFSNPEFQTTLNFDKYRRLNLVDDNIDEKEKIIITLGDSFTMGWGVENDETFAYNLQKIINQKTLNLGVASYGTVREIKRLKLNKFYEQAKTIIIQYHVNDIYENKSLDINKSYSREDYDKYFSSRENNTSKIIYILRYYKKSFRLLFSHINDIIFKKKEIHNLNTHLEYLEKIINQNLKDQDKRIIVFLVKEPHQNFIYKKEKNFANFEFLIIDTQKEHFFIIDDHLNVNGHKYIAKRLANYLSK